MNIRTMVCLLLLASASVWAQSQLKPLGSFWYADTNNLTSDRMDLLSTELKTWNAARVFDGYIWHILPPTFTDPQPVIAVVNSLNVVLNGKAIASTLPVGTEGWETSYNAQFAVKNGCVYDPAKAVSEDQWLQSIQTSQENTWGWVDGNGKSMPTPDQAGRSAAAFVSAAKAQDKKAAIWLSAQALAGQPLAMLQQICAVTKDTADYFAWMDVETSVAVTVLGHAPTTPGEGKMSPAMLAELSKTLDAILALSPKEKTYIQWINGPNDPTQDVAGTTAFIAECQQKGINNFILLANVNELKQDPWRGFYASLAKPKSGGRTRRRP